MSTLSQFSGGGIKSIQRGTISAPNAGTATATITAVNTAKTMLNFCGCSTGFQSGGGIGESARIALTSSTQITANNRGVNTAFPPTVSYEVIEYF